MKKALIRLLSVKRSVTLRVLDKLTEKRNPFRSNLISLVGMLSPKAGALAQFRIGNVRKSLTLAKIAGDARLIRRSESILSGSLEKSISVATSGPVRADQTRHRSVVLQLFHSEGYHDNNGYASRSTQILTALKTAGIETVAITRLGYPWDIARHSEEPVRTQTAHRGFHYSHLHDPERLIGDSEDRYIRAYAASLLKHPSVKRLYAIHGHSNYLNGLAAAIVGQKMKVPTVYEARGLWHLTRSFNQPAYHNSEHFQYCESMEVLAAHATTALVTLTEQLKNWFVDHGVAEEKITVIPNAAPIVDPLEPLTAGRSSFTVGYIGSLTHYEGVDLLLGAFARFNKRQSKSKLLIVGEGEARKDLERQCRALNLGDSVEFAGRVHPEKVRKLYQRCHVCVVPRTSTELTELVAPLKPMEVMAHGVPLIASSVAPISDSLGRGGECILFETGCTESLTEALLRVHDSAELRNTLRTAGLQWCKQNSWIRNAEAYQRLYLQLAAN